MGPMVSGAETGGRTQGICAQGPCPLYSLRRCFPPVQKTTESSPAGCPSGQRERTVNPSRKLHRFESYTCHSTRRRPRAGSTGPRSFGAARQLHRRFGVHQRRCVISLRLFVRCQIGSTWKANAPLAQSVERFHGKEKVDGSIPSGGSLDSDPGQRRS